MQCELTVSDKQPDHCSASRLNSVNYKCVLFLSSSFILRILHQYNKIFCFEKHLSFLSVSEYLALITKPIFLYTEDSKKCITKKRSTVDI